MSLSVFEIAAGEKELDQTESRWLELETRYTVIRYDSIKTLEEFHKSIHFGDGWWASSASFIQLSAEEHRKISELKMDAVFNWVQEILDMNKKFKKILINLYPDKKRLGEAYAKEYGEVNPFKAWYEFKTNTISLNVQDCEETDTAGNRYFQKRSGKTV